MTKVFKIQTRKLCKCFAAPVVDCPAVYDAQTIQLGKYHGYKAQLVRTYRKKTRRVKTVLQVGCHTTLSAEGACRLWGKGTNDRGEDRSRALQMIANGKQAAKQAGWRW